ncbi:molybdopterin-dependent oxidoreductase [uncultured Litoreibacter sp.]|uniref:molybdopterin-dependent oxidoreductase n=1 Tax=uncultured Litoreibacter sp. TaxID=1392394 RepID=UPI0026373AE6|nr:molybdopterin-dependent oxidoreductase [uncultured Litoreibacter sp.]
MAERTYLTTNHWGTYRAVVEDGKLVEMRAFEEDKDPSSIGQGIVDALNAPSRITSPMVRESWLRDVPGARTDLRGKDRFVALDWPEVEELVAREITRVRDTHGSNAIYAGSYGWASAGRFHHAQSQLKRFLNCTGGFTSSKFTYSFAAAEAMIPHVLGSYREFLNTTNSWSAIADHGQLVVAFGGIPIKNSQIDAGGMGVHSQRAGIEQAVAAGVEFVNISPLKGDVIPETNAEWLPARPNSDVALMLALAHTIYTEKLHAQAFLDRYCVGFERFADYLTGATDSVAKDADWAASLTEIPADTIRALARRMARRRTVVSVAWSLTRQDHGEQPFWMAITLAAMLGQIGTPGGGFAFGFAATNSIGADYPLLKGGSLPQGQNGVTDYIPVARITDLLLGAGKTVEFDGHSLTYPDIKLVWWAGGNPYHHHQDLNALAKAWEKPDTVICNDWCWTPTAKRADIVLPCTTHVERDDISMSQRDPYVIRVEQAVPPPADVRNDYDIFTGIARQMGLETQFTEDKTADDWIREIYGKTAFSAGKVGDLASTEVDQAKSDQPKLNLPDWEAFCAKGWLKVETNDPPRVMLQRFVDDPESNPLNTPSGKIEIFSETVAGFGYRDCFGHPAWFDPYEWLGNATGEDLHLISNQPSTKLHSQLDQGAISLAGKIDGREPVLINPQDAKRRAIAHGDLVRLFNARGACLAVAQVSDDVRDGVVQMATGAWWDPDESGMCRHGNPNALTRDKGTSDLGQGPTAHTCLVKIERFDRPAPAVRAFDPPEIIDGRQS